MFKLLFDADSEQRLERCGGIELSYKFLFLIRFMFYSFYLFRNQKVYLKISKMGGDNVMHQGSLLTSSLIMKTTEIESANEGYKFGQGVGYLSPVCPIIHMLK